jgi:hypothetical protein
MWQRKLLLKRFKEIFAININRMFNHKNIITATMMFGSMHILSTCLKGLNKRWIKYGISDFSFFEMINLSIGLIAGTMLIAGYKSIENR